MSDLQRIDDWGLLDLNFAVEGEEKAEGCAHIDLNTQVVQGSPSVAADIRYKNPISSYHKPHSLVAEFDQDDARTTKIDYDWERSQPLNNGNFCQGEMDELPANRFHKSSSESKAQSFHRERGTEDSAHSQESSLTSDDNQIEEMEGDSNTDGPNASPLDEKVMNALLEKSQDESPYNEIEGESIEHREEKLSSYSRSPLVDGEFEQKTESYHSSRNSPAESRKLDIPHSVPHSHGCTCGRSASPAAGKPPWVSPQGSPHVHQSPDGHSPLSLQERAQDHLHSRTLHIQKHSSSFARSDPPNRISSYGHLSPTVTQTSVSPKWSQQDYHQRNGSQKHTFASTEPHCSPEKYGRCDRSISRSPIRRKDPFSGYGRDYSSRSPCTRDRYRSPKMDFGVCISNAPNGKEHSNIPKKCVTRRRRRSPWRKSPSRFHSRHSPRRRPWSPPPNRRTGLAKPGKNLFVAGFNFLTTERYLERKFSRFGHVQDVRIVRGKRSVDSRGFGFLSLERDEDADAAIRTLDETEWNGRIILVEKSKSAR